MRRFLFSLFLAVAFIPAYAQFTGEVEDTLSTSVVTAAKERPRNTTQTGMSHIDPAYLNRGAVFLGTPDIIKSLLTLPGVAAGNELMSGISVHGGDGNDNLYLLDGIPLYNISHFGGIFSSFNTDITSGVDFYKSGFPARYGTKLSSVIDVETSDGDFYKYHGNVSLGLIDGRVRVGGPIVKGKTSFNVAYRRSWLGMMIALGMKIKKVDDSKVKYLMNDLNAGVTHRFNDNNTLKVSFYWGADNLALGLSPEQMNMDLKVKWGNIVGAATWNCKVSREFRSSLSAYYTQSVSNTDYTIANGKDGMSDVIDSGIREAGLKYGIDWYPSDSHHLRAGTHLAFKMYRYLGQAEDSSDPESTTPRVRHNSFESSFYIEDEFFIARRFTLNYGLRYTLYSGKAKTWHSIEPRAALKWSPANWVDLRASYSRMSQSDHLVSSSYLELPSNTWMPSTGKIRPIVSDQVSAGLYFKPLKGMNVNFEGWYKAMKHLQYYVGPNSMFPPVQKWETSFAEGKGESYGLESEVSWSDEKISAKAYYTLSWSRRFFDSVYPEWFFAPNDNRHKVNLLFSYRIIKSLEVNANWTYHTGNRVTFPSNVTIDGTYLYDCPNNFSLPDYHRLDLAVTYTLYMKHDQSLEFNASVYNVYNHKNAFFAYMERDTEGNFTGEAYSVIPVFPTLSITYRF